MLKFCPGINDYSKCLYDLDLTATEEEAQVTHPGLYDFNENAYYSTSPQQTIKEYLESDYPE